MLTPSTVSGSQSPRNTLAFRCHGVSKGGLHANPSHRGSSRNHKTKNAAPTDNDAARHWPSTPVRHRWSTPRLSGTKPTCAGRRITRACSEQLERDDFRLQTNRTSMDYINRLGDVLRRFAFGQVAGLSTHEPPRL